MADPRNEEKIQDLLKGRILARVHAEEASDVSGGKTLPCGQGCDEIVIDKSPSEDSSPLSEAATSESLPDPPRV